MPSKQLPARPNLEHLRAQAKTLLHKLREGDPQAARDFVQHLPEAASLTLAEILARNFRLADAQSAVARKNGFAAWPGLARHVERLRHLEGTWAFESLEIDGNAIPASFFTSSRLLIDGDRFRTESPEGNYEGIFTIDVEASPQRIDIDFIEGPEAGNRCEGLFELLGPDRIRFCLGLAGSSRPAGFVTSPGSGHALESLVRIEHARPPGVDGGTPQELPEPAPAADPRDAASFDAPPTTLHQQLEGEWIPLELITAGKPLAESYLPYGSRTHSGTHTKVVFGGQTMIDAKTRFLSLARSPIEIDYLHLAGKDQGALSHGLFRWDDDDRTIAVFCFAPPGSPRPNDFTSTAANKHTFSRWRRKLG